MNEIKTAQDALAAWDRGDIVQTVEMGGIGPGYEQAIQVLVFEIIRAGGDHEAAIKACSREVGGFSGAQVGAARSLARHALEKGWAETLAAVEADRRILVSRNFPGTCPFRPPVSPPSEGAPSEGKETTRGE